MRYTASARTGLINLVLRRDGSRLLLLDGGVLVGSGDVDHISDIFIGGPDHQNTSLTVDYAFGPIRIPIDYHPGALGSNTENLLSIRGASFTTESHGVTGPHSGVITLDGVPIVYSNLTPIDDTVPAVNFSFTAPAGAGTINVNTNGVIGGFQTDQINDGGTGKFELVNFANKTTVTVNGDGTTPTTFTVNIPAPASGLANLNVQGGGAGSVFNVQAVLVPAGFTTNVIGGVNATVNVGLGGSLAAIQAPLNITNPGSLNTVVIDDSSDGTGRTPTIGSGQVTVPGLIPFPISFDAHTSSLTFNGGGGSDTFTVTPSASTAFTVNGNNPPPPASPGDYLMVNMTGLTNPVLTSSFTPTGYQGHWAFGNAKDVNFATIESLKPGGTPQPIVILGGAVPGSTSISGTTTPEIGANTCISVFNCGVDNICYNGDDTLLGQAGVNSAGQFTVSLSTPLIAGEQIYAMDTCAATTGPVVVITQIMAVPAASSAMLGALALLFSLIALYRLRRRQTRFR